MRPVLPALALLLVALPTVAGQAAPVEIETHVLLVNFGNYDANKGTYVMDFYVWFLWNATQAPEGFTPERFEFMNGRAGARERIFDETNPTTGMRELWYRVQANLYTDPLFAEYPYDRQRLAILFEDPVYTLDTMRYEPDLAKSGLDENVRVAGWRIEGWSMEETEKTYRFDETYSRLVFAMEIAREPVSTTVKTFLPPLAFMVVSGLSFFFHPSKVANRLGLGTSMLISAVLYHISQIVNLPSGGRLMLLDKIMFSVYAFLAGSLIVTTLIAIDEDYWKDRDHTREINLYGGLGTLLLPFVVFALIGLF